MCLVNVSFHRCGRLMLQSVNVPTHKDATWRHWQSVGHAPSEIFAGFWSRQPSSASENRSSAFYFFTIQMLKEFSNLCLLEEAQLHLLSNQKEFDSLTHDVTSAMMYARYGTVGSVVQSVWCLSRITGTIWDIHQFDYIKIPFPIGLFIIRRESATGGVH